MLRTLGMYILGLIILSTAVMGFKSPPTPQVETRPSSVTTKSVEYTTGPQKIKELKLSMLGIITNLKFLGNMENNNLDYQYNINCNESKEMVKILNSIPDQDPIKTDIVKVLDSVDKFSYALQRRPVDYTLISTERDNVIKAMTVFDRKYK